MVAEGLSINVEIFICLSILDFSFSYRYTLTSLVFCFHSGVNGLICLESDNEPESGRGKQKEKENELVTSGFGVVEDLDWRFSFVESTCPLGMLMLYLEFP